MTGSSIKHMTTARCAWALLLALLVVGCRGVATHDERHAREHLGNLTAGYRPEGYSTNLPSLMGDVTVESLLRYAMLRHPRVAASYYDYAAAVQGITLERSLPDPRLTLELDIQEAVMVVMPGLMAEIPFVQKLRVGADMAAAESQVRYFAFERAVLETALQVKQAFFRLHFLEARIQVTEEMALLAGDLETIAQARMQAGQAGLQDVLRAQIEQERLRNELANLRDSHRPLMARLRAALGLQADDPDPALPQGFVPTPLSLTPEQLWEVALTRNPRLRQMEAEIRMAESGIRLAHLSRLPDFSAGIEADVKASPIMWRPSLGVTLPIWRDKIAAELAAAQAREQAGRERLSAEQIELAVEFAERSFMYREASRNLESILQQLLPRSRHAVEVAHSAYTSAVAGFLDLLEAHRTLLEIRLAEIDARSQRELTLADLSLLIAGLPPVGSPTIDLTSTHSPMPSKIP